MAYAKKTKTKKQVAYLFSKSSPLSNTQKLKMSNELHTGMIKVRKAHKKRI